MDDTYRTIMRDLTPTQKMRALQGLQKTARDALKAGIKMRQPEISDAALMRLVRDAILHAKH